MNESDIQKQILDWLRMVPGTLIFVWRQNQGASLREYKGKKRFYKMTDVKGVSDIIGVCNGLPLAIEVKAGYNKPTKQQMQFLKDFSKAGGIATCAWCLEDVIPIVKQCIKNPQIISHVGEPIITKRNKYNADRSDAIAKIYTRRF